MAHLIPQVRVNKNGVPVTKHVLPDNAPRGGNSSIPSPALQTAPKKKPLKLLPRQKEVQHQALNRTTFRPSEEFLKALPFTYNGTANKYHVSDEAAYGMFSTMRVNDALHLIHFGYEDKDAALEFLDANGMSSLAQDNSKMMQEALERRLPALNFVELHGKYGMNGHPKGLFLDAVEAYSSGTLRSLDRTELNTVHLKVLAGDLSLADIKAVGISRIHKSNAAHSVLNALQFMKAGKLDCTVSDIRALIDKNNEEDNLPTPLKWALQSINSYGADFFKETYSLLNAHAMAEHFESKKMPVPEIKKLITYKGTMRGCGGYPSYADVKALSDAGIPADVAGQLYEGKDSIPKIISAHREGIPVAVTGGWL